MKIKYKRTEDRRKEKNGLNLNEVFQNLKYEED